jgi:hypothetical protein
MASEAKLALLAMTIGAFTIYDCTRQKEGPPKRAFEDAADRRNRDQAVLV